MQEVFFKANCTIDGPRQIYNYCYTLKPSRKCSKPEENVKIKFAAVHCPTTRPDMSLLYLAANKHVSEGITSKSRKVFVEKISYNFSQFSLLTNF